ncbi:MAG: carbon-nitrogen hydrolase family protein [Cohaesibacter sp.]|jgi:predicted amidohydrolase|nr:carbon-nitrogen hydrolase family protein [Cohaesibacter sp.]
MTVFRAACVQLRAGRDITANLDQAESLIREAAADGCSYIQTPEQTATMELNRARLMEKISFEDQDEGLKRLCALSRELGIWLHIGSMAFKVSTPDGAREKAANRSLLIGPDGAIAARYDKIHMFDVDLANGESYRESSSFEAGTKAVLASLPWGQLGLSICYDLRFPALYRGLCHKGADFLAVPAAFTEKTGKAHWHILLRARAIENGAYVLAAAQGGEHENGRQTYGHSVIIDPWGSVLAEAGKEPSFIAADIDPAKVAHFRRSVPSLANERDFDL